MCGLHVCACVGCCPREFLELHLLSLLVCSFSLSSFPFRPFSSLLAPRVHLACRLDKDGLVPVARMAVPGGTPDYICPELLGAIQGVCVSVCVCVCVCVHMYSP
jgi:hypothetical protein